MDRYCGWGVYIICICRRSGPYFRILTPESGKKNEVRTELPQAVKSAVISKYVAYAIEQFSFEENSVYKLILKGDRNKLIVYYTADGEYLSQETVKTVQMVALI